MFGNSLICLGLPINNWIYSLRKLNFTLTLVANDCIAFSCLMDEGEVESAEDAPDVCALNSVSILFATVFNFASYKAATSVSHVGGCEPAPFNHFSNISLQPWLASPYISLFTVSIMFPSNLRATATSSQWGVTSSITLMSVPSMLYSSCSLIAECRGSDVQGIRCVGDQMCRRQKSNIQNQINVFNLSMVKQLSTYHIHSSTMMNDM